jgi:hypothetical protein
MIVDWLVGFIDSRAAGKPRTFTLCDGWIDLDGARTYRWALREL